MGQVLNRIPENNKGRKDFSCEPGSLCVVGVLGSGTEDKDFSTDNAPRGRDVRRGNDRGNLSGEAGRLRHEKALPNQVRAYPASTFTSYSDTRGKWRVYLFSFTDYPYIPYQQCRNAGECATCKERCDCSAKTVSFLEGRKGLSQNRHIHRYGATGLAGLLAWAGQAITGILRHFN